MYNKKKCPVCGSESFYVKAHVVQEWKVNKYGDYIETTEDCVEVAHYPKDDDIWGCENCGYQATGHAFNVQEEEDI